MKLLIMLPGLVLAAAAVPALAADNVTTRGRYLVEQVAMCSDCHTPRDDKGALIASKSLQGAPIGFRPLAPIPFAEHAPKIAGVPGHYTEAQLITFLQTGKRPDGSLARPPMPEYHFSRADARAVVAYLRTLPPGD